MNQSDCDAHNPDINVFRLPAPEIAIRYNVVRLILSGELSDPAEFVRNRNNNTLLRVFIFLHLDVVRLWIAKFRGL